MRITRKQFFLLFPLAVLLIFLAFPAQLTQDQTMVWINGNEQEGSYNWDGMADPASEDSHTLYLKLPTVRPVFFHLVSGSGAHGINLLPGSPRAKWRDSQLHRNTSGRDWVYPQGGWTPTRSGVYLFYCPLHPKMWLKVVATR